MTRLDVTEGQKAIPSTEELKVGSAEPHSGGNMLAEGHSAKTELMPKYKPILSEKGWIYPDGRIALTARETRKRLPATTQELSLIHI